ncbi:MAG: response regulator transcription factor [Candidatus Eisenbacteria bacterium]|nr:response regulator transcription factor [Candidatus Eisenbacteria bacterium]
MKLRSVIVEDEPLAVERLAGLLSQIPEVDLLASFDRAQNALTFLQSNPVDLLFLDVSLGGMSGLELLETSLVRAEVILTTAHPEHALRAFDLKVADYLLKPFTLARLAQGVEQVRARLSTARSAVDLEFIFVKTEFRLERVDLRQVLYIEGEGDYRRIHLLRRQILTPETLGDFERRVPPEVLCRVHKSYLVAVGRIDAIERDRIRIGDTVIPVSDRYREHFRATLRRHGG